MESQAKLFAALLVVCFVSQTLASKACFVCTDKDRSNPDCRKNFENMKHINNCKRQPPHVLKEILQVDEALFDLADEKDFKCMTLEAVNSTNSLYVRACVPSYTYCSALLDNSIAYPANGEVKRCRICDIEVCNSEIYDYN